MEMKSPFYERWNQNGRTLNFKMKCHSHYFDDKNIHLFPEGFAFIS